MEKRIEAGWGQRLAWVALVWGCAGFLVWLPFLYVAIRRGRPADWGAFASFVLYELVAITLSNIMPDGDNTLLGAVALITLTMATLLLLFAEFDKTTPPMPYGAAPAPQPGPPYGYPYGR